MQASQGASTLRFSTHVDERPLQRAEVLEVIRGPLQSSKK